AGTPRTPLAKADERKRQCAAVRGESEPSRNLASALDFAPRPCCVHSMSPFWTSVSVLLVLLNPFALSVYLAEVLQEQPFKDLTRILQRASLIAFGVFALFAWG